MTITYEIYLDCLRVGLVPNPEEIKEANICPRINCDDCPISNILACWDNYIEASKTYYPTLLTQNPELAL